MGRWCTARRSAATGRVAVTAAVLAAVLATTAALPGATSLAPGLAAGSAGSAAGYDFADDAVRIAGARATAGAEPLAAGATYRSSLPRNGTLYYRLELDAASDAYVSVTAVPGADGEVTAVDGIRVSVQDAEGGSCSVQSATFGAARSPRPVTARGMREIDPAAHRCQDPGTYYVGVERTRPQDSPPDDWDLELTVATEPRPRETGATKAPRPGTPPRPNPSPASRNAGRAATDSPTPPSSDRGSGATTSGPGRPFTTRCRSTGGARCTPPPNSPAPRTPPAMPPVPCGWPCTTPCAARWTTRPRATPGGPPRSASPPAAGGVPQPVRHRAGRGAAVRR